MPSATSKDELQATLAQLDYPMLIVTTTDGRRRGGCLVGFSAQCSIDPPLLMVWLSKRNHTARVAAGAANLMVHFPACDQRDLAVLFGSETGDDIDKFERCRWQEGPAGLPLLADCTHWVAGRIVHRLDTGDHTGHLLEPFDAASGPWSGPLEFQSIRGLDPGHEA